MLFRVLESLTLTVLIIFTIEGTVHLHLLLSHSMNPCNILKGVGLPLLSRFCFFFSVPSFLYLFVIAPLKTFLRLRSNDTFSFLLLQKSGSYTINPMLNQLVCFAYCVINQWCIKSP